MIFLIFLGLEFKIGQKILKSESLSQKILCCCMDDTKKLRNDIMQTKIKHFSNITSFTWTVNEEHDIALLTSESIA